MTQTGYLDILFLIIYSIFLAGSVTSFILFFVRFFNSPRNKRSPIVFLAISLFFIFITKLLIENKVVKAFNVGQLGLPLATLMFKFSVIMVSFFLFFCFFLVFFANIKKPKNKYIKVKRINKSFFLVAKRDFNCFDKKIRKGTIGAKLVNYSIKNFINLGIDDMCFWADSESTIFCDTASFGKGTSLKEQKKQEILIEESNILGCFGIAAPTHLRNCCISGSAFIQGREKPFNYCDTTNMYYRIKTDDSIRKNDICKLIPCNKKFIFFIVKNDEKTKIKIINTEEPRISNVKTIDNLYNSFESWEELADCLLKNCIEKLDKETSTLAKQICLCVSNDSWLFDTKPFMHNEYMDFHFAQLCGAMIDLLLFSSSPIVNALNSVSIIDIVSKRQRLINNFVFLGTAVKNTVGEENYNKIKEIKSNTIYVDWI